MSESSFSSRWLLILVLLIAVPVQPAHAEDVRIVLANDFFTANNTDDLYTGALALGFDLGQYRLSFGENIFTDRENEIRFDETYLGIERGLPDLGGWHSAVEVGVIHVGRGVLGQSTQNSLHRLIGDEEVDLPYVETDRYHPTLRLRFHRPLRDGHRLSMSAYGELFSAFDFRQHATTGVKVHWPGWSFASFNAGIGARYTTTSFEALKPRIETLAATWEAGVRFRNSMKLSWTYNEFGTKSQHFTLGYDVKWKRTWRHESRS